MKEELYIYIYIKKKEHLSELRCHLNMEQYATNQLQKCALLWIGAL